jgi:hypothetical protein
MVSAVREDEDEDFELRSVFASRNLPYASGLAAVAAET